MDFSTLLLGTMLAVLALAGAGLLTVMVVLERPGPELEPAPALAGGGSAPDKHNKARRRRRRPAGGRCRRS